MTRDEAMKVWRNAFLAFFTNGAVDQNSRDVKAAATVIQQAFAERDGEIEQDAARYRWLRDESCPPHNFYVSVPDEFKGVRYSRADVDAYIDEARQALTAKGDSRG